MALKANSSGRVSPTRREFYAFLGVTVEGEGDAAAAHNELVGFLKGAPDGVRQWAEEEIATADEAYELLLNPAAAPTTRRRPIKRFAVAAAVVVIAAGVGIGVYHMGGGKSASKSQKAQEAKVGQDKKKSLTPTQKAQVELLMKKVQKQPKDVATIVRIGNIFFGAGDYSSAGGWMARAVKIDPKNVTARLALGASQFNLGGVPDARRTWMRVIEIDPKNIEAYYDLGFLYLSQKKPNMAAAKKAWRKVVEIAPNSSTAKSVADHLKRLENSKGTDGSDSRATSQSEGGK